MTAESHRALRARLGEDAFLVRAPGRVNLIGEHTDYNDGFVLPAAIDRYTWVAAAPRDDRKLVVHSEDLGETVAFDLDDLDADVDEAALPTGARGGAGPSGRPGPGRGWGNYPRGVAHLLRESGVVVRGARLRVASDLPIGAGLSSSAALEVAVGLALLRVAGATLDPMSLARLCQRAECEVVGTRCGIMDQAISCLGREGHALWLDCRSSATRAIPLPPAVRLVICNSMVRHELSAGEYNRRRVECDAGVAALRAASPAQGAAGPLAALRDATLADLERARPGMGDAVYRRCRHVVSENDRVLAFAAALERGDLESVGPLMAASHASLRDDFEVSCRELDLLVELAAPLDGLLGTRMTGGGFGGCTVSLVRADAVPAFRHRVAGGFRRETGTTPEILVCAAAGAAAVVDDSDPRSSP